jgi:serine/threonine protein kinase
MTKEHFDMRTLIDHNMKSSIVKDCGPFSKEEVEVYMFEIALGMSWLHGLGIVHRDLKAPNVLMSICVDGRMQCFVADYECSIGVVGTGFFRAPEILQAFEDKSVSRRPELFTKQSDAYSYTMTCYEMLLGRLSFNDHSVNDYASVISGERPEIPGFVDAWMDNLLRECWQLDPSARPSFEDVVNTIVDNSP